MPTKKHKKTDYSCDLTAFIWGSLYWIYLYVRWEEHDLCKPYHYVRKNELYS